MKRVHGSTLNCEPVNQNAISSQVFSIQLSTFSELKGPLDRKWLAANNQWFQATSDYFSALSCAVDATTNDEWWPVVNMFEGYLGNHSLDHLQTSNYQQQSNSQYMKHFLHRRPFMLHLLLNTVCIWKETFVQFKGQLMYFNLAYFTLIYLCSLHVCVCESAFSQMWTEGWVAASSYRAAPA